MTRPFCVLVSGMLCDASIFAAQTEALPELDTQVIQVTAASIDEAVEAILASTPQRFSLVGYSLGGIVSMACAVRAPDRVLNLGLIATNPHAPRPEQRTLWTTWRHMLARGQFEDVVEQVTTGMLATGSASWMTDVARQMASGVGPETFDRQLQLQATREDLLPQLHRVTARTAVIAGARDPLCPVSNHTDISERIKGSALHVYDDAGHLITFQKKLETTKILRDLLLGA